MKRQFAVLTAFLLLFAMACGSMNRATPKEWDAKTMEADVRSKIAAVDPSKTFAVEVETHRQRFIVRLTRQPKEQCARG